MTFRVAEKSIGNTWRCSPAYGVGFKKNIFSAAQLAQPELSEDRKVIERRVEALNR